MLTAEQLKDMRRQLDEARGFVSVARAALIHFDMQETVDIAAVLRGVENTLGEHVGLLEGHAPISET